jgi:hypothetical protein
MALSVVSVPRLEKVPRPKFAYPTSLGNHHLQVMVFGFDPIEWCGTGSDLLAYYSPRYRSSTFGQLLPENVTCEFIHSLKEADILCMMVPLGACCFFFNGLARKVAIYRT